MRSLILAIFLVLITIFNGLTVERAGAAGIGISSDQQVEAAPAEITTVSDECLPSLDGCAGEYFSERLDDVHCAGECPAWLARTASFTTDRAAVVMYFPHPLLRVASTALHLRPPIAA